MNLHNKAIHYEPHELKHKSPKAPQSRQPSFIPLPLLPGSAGCCWDAVHRDGQQFCPGLLSLEAVYLSLTEGQGGGTEGTVRGQVGSGSHRCVPQLPDERHAVSEARVAQRPPRQGPEVPAPPQVPAAAAELHGPQEMEGK